MTDTMNIEVDATCITEILLDLNFDRLPSASVRGNSRLHHIPKALATKAELEFGVLVGMQAIAKAPKIKFPRVAICSRLSENVNIRSTLLSSYLYVACP